MDYWRLLRPRIVALVLLAMAVSAWITAPSPRCWPDVAHALVGAALVIAAAVALNQRLEWHTDAQMPRTAGRPLPAGRLSRRQVAYFGLATTAIGLTYLATATNAILVLLAAIGWLVYVGVYTPLKTRSTWQTPVGAAAGATPVLLGAAAVGRFAQPLGMDPVCNRLLLAIPALDGHRLALSAGVRRGRRESGPRHRPHRPDRRNLGHPGRQPCYCQSVWPRCSSAWPAWPTGLPPWCWARHILPCPCGSPGARTTPPRIGYSSRRSSIFLRCSRHCSLHNAANTASASRVRGALNGSCRAWFVKDHLWSFPRSGNRPGVHAGLEAADTPAILLLPHMSAPFQRGSCLLRASLRHGFGLKPATARRPVNGP